MAGETVSKLRAGSGVPRGAAVMLAWEAHDWQRSGNSQEPVSSPGRDLINSIFKHPAILDLSV